MSQKWKRKINRFTAIEHWSWRCRQCIYYNHWNIWSLEQL